MFAEKKDQYLESSRSKEDKLHYLKELHKVLMDTGRDFSRFLADTDIQSICFGKEDISFMTGTGQQRIEITVNEEDFDGIPMSAVGLGRYEKEEFGMVKKILELCKGTENFTVFDVGANIGWYSLHIMKCFPDMKVFSFEPALTTYNRLCHNLSKNGFEKSNAYNIGFYEEKSKLKFYFDQESSGASSLANIREKDNIDTIYVDVEKMDEWIGAHGVERVDFIKCDVEGAEMFVFKGGIKSIEKYKPIIFSEMLRKWSAKFGYHPNDMIRMFEDLGYQCFVITEEGKLHRFGYVDENTVETNYFFLHPEKHGKVIEEICS